MEYSKKILNASWAAAITLTVIVVVFSMLGLDTDAVVTLAALSWGELTAAHGFYFWKAKCENKIKLTKQMVLDWAEKYGSEFVTELARTIFYDE